MLHLLSILLLFTLGSCDEDEAVFTLTTENFDEFISSHPRVLVEFYAPWCGHCKALAPEFEKAAAALNADESVEAVLGKVDATEEKDLATKYGVSGFPTLKYFTGDVESPDDYSGGRTETTIISWIRARSLPPVSVLDSAEAVEAFKDKSSVVLVGFVAEDSEAASALEAVAEANRESIVVGLVTNSEVAVDGVEYGNVYMFRGFGDPIVQYEGEATVDGLNDFLNAERFPLIDAIGPENYKDYMDRGLPLVWISISADDEDMVDNVIGALTPYAAQFKGRLSFTWVDAVKYAQHVQNLGIAETPGLLIVGEQKYLFDGDVADADALSAYFAGYDAGTLDAYLKSEDAPEEQDGDVFVLVGKEFASVIGQDKDVFVEYYAPWCGHCKRLAPEYETVGEAFSDVSDLIIAKIDATENDTPEDIRGFPTLIFYPKGTAPPNGIKYSGDRKSDAIIDWIKESATVDISGTKTEL